MAYLPGRSHAQRLDLAVISSDASPCIRSAAQHFQTYDGEGHLLLGARLGVAGLEAPPIGRVTFAAVAAPTGMVLASLCRCAPGYGGDSTSRLPRLRERAR